MRYTPKTLKTNVNVSPSSPVKELLLLLTGALAILILLYLALGFCVDLIAPKISPRLEERLGGLFSQFYADELHTTETERLQRLLDEEVKELPEKRLNYSVHLVENNQINAIALPGGHIVVFTGLLKEINTDDALAFVLGHELGHFIHHDHLRGLGRGLTLWALSAFLLGADNSVTTFLGHSLLGIQMKYTRQQETQADMFALEITHRTFHNVSGAVEFMQQLAEKEKRGPLAYYFATHPYPKDRIADIEEEIREKGYSLFKKN